MNKKKNFEMNSYFVLKTIPFFLSQRFQKFKTIVIFNNDFLKIC